MYLRIGAVRQTLNSFLYYQKEENHDPGASRYKRLNLRRYIVDTQNSLKNLVRFVRSQRAEHLLDCEAYLIMEELWKDALDEGRSIEAEVRDNMQIEASELSLEESRKSILLSNHQIEESRRGNNTAVRISYCC